MKSHVYGVAPVGRLIRWVCLCGAAGPFQELVRKAKMGGSHHAAAANRGGREFLDETRAAWLASGNAGRWLDASREYASARALERRLVRSGASNERIRIFWTRWLKLWHNVGALHAHPSAGFSALRSKDDTALRFSLMELD